MEDLEKPAIKVLLVDDHEMVRIGLAAVLGTEDGIEVVGEAAAARRAYAWPANTSRMWC